MTYDSGSINVSCSLKYLNRLNSESRDSNGFSNKLKIYSILHLVASLTLLTQFEILGLTYENIFLTNIYVEAIIVCTCVLFIDNSVII